MFWRRHTALTDRHPAGDTAGKVTVTASYAVTECCCRLISDFWRYCIDYRQTRFTGPPTQAVSTSWSEQVKDGRTSRLEPMADRHGAQAGLNGW